VLLARGGIKLMAANPRIVTADRQIFWDGVVQRLPKGQQIDVPPGSPLERAIGAQFLVPLPGTTVQVPAEEVAPQPEPVPQEEPPTVPVKSRTAPKKDSARDGGP
jgi:hypothetical protein